MTRHPRVHQPNFRAKLLGAILLIIGGAFASYAVLLTPNPPDFFYLKLAFASLLIGVFMMLLITEESVPRRISDAQIEGNLIFVKKMTKELKLLGNAVFLPQSPLLSEERVYIPAEKTAAVPYIDDQMVLNLRHDGEVIGLSVPPAGLELLKEVEKEGSFRDTDLDTIEEKLQTFVGMNILRGVTLKKTGDRWRLELEHQQPCCGDAENQTCNQYPCAACSAVLTAVTQASKEKIRILETNHIGNKTIFHLKIGGV